MLTYSTWIEHHASPRKEYWCGKGYQSLDDLSRQQKWMPHIPNSCKLISGARKEFSFILFVWIWRIWKRPFSSGRLISTWTSKHPGLKSAHPKFNTGGQVGGRRYSSNGALQILLLKNLLPKKKYTDDLLQTEHQLKVTWYCNTKK